ncbi:hypothetical protein [Petroclostridium sp. X23]|nr:hypothetical protein [Petroclostridium sp. X23]WHH58903.1 hypothetical protein QKW49_24445 [Petroclostridium sp. X23]
MKYKKNILNTQSIYKRDYSWTDDPPVWEEESEELTNTIDQLRQRSQE